MKVLQPLQAAATGSKARGVTLRTRGITHGSITRLMSPGDLGHELKPFVFLDLFDINLHDPRAGFSIHPHSGLATITVITDGDLRFDDPTDGTGHIDFGGLEWMRAGEGVWHGKELSGGTSARAKGFQLWIALRSELEHAPVDSQYVEAGHVPTVGPAHVILGAYGEARSPARAPEGVTYLLVKLLAGTKWTFMPPADQTTAWLSVASGRLAGETSAVAGELLVFDQSAQFISLVAGPDADAVFVIGSAEPHPHDLHLGSYSVHTSGDSLIRGETSIERLRKLLVEAGDRRSESGTISVFSGRP